jgi:hypothetical protein
VREEREGRFDAAEPARRPTTLAEVVSGDGVDRGALDAALAAGFSHLGVRRIAGYESARRRPTGSRMGETIWELQNVFEKITLDLAQPRR